MAPAQIVVGYDASPLSELALYRALRSAQKSVFCMVNILMVAEKTAAGVRLPSGENVPSWVARETLRHDLQEKASRWGIEDPRIRILANLRWGEPAQEIVEFSYRMHAEQIMVGARSSTSSSLRIGSTAQQILGLTDIPVHVEAASHGPFEATSPNAIEKWGYAVRGRTLFSSSFPAWRAPASA